MHTLSALYFFLHGLGTIIAGLVYNSMSSKF